MSFSLQNWYDKMQSENVLFAHKGTITSDLITNVLDTVEHKLEEAHEVSKIKRKVYNVLVEALQNLYHHIDVPPDGEYDNQFAIFILSKENQGEYKISTGNFVRKNKTKLLKDRLEQLNFLSKEELKGLYKMILNNEEFSEKGGGGLGMIDIARKTGNKFGFNFQNVDKEYFFFSLDVLISK